MHRVYTSQDFFLPFPEIPDNGIPFFTRNARELKQKLCYRMKNAEYFVMCCILFEKKARV